MCNSDCGIAYVIIGFCVMGIFGLFAFMVYQRFRSPMIYGGKKVINNYFYNTRDLELLGIIDHFRIGPQSFWREHEEFYYCAETNEIFKIEGDEWQHINVNALVNKLIDDDQSELGESLFKRFAGDNT